MNNKHTRQQENVFWTSVLTGVILAVVKGIVGYVAGNKALIGDALYTASGAAEILTKRFSDRSHRYRHTGAQSMRHPIYQPDPLGKGSLFAHILITVLLLLGGLEIAISAVGDIVMHAQPDPKPLAIVIVFLTLAINEGIFRYRYRYAYTYKSTHLNEEIDYHRYSLYTSILVLAGMLGTIAALELEQNSLYYIQPISAILVSMILWRQGYCQVRRTIYGRLVRTMQQDDSADYLETVQRVQGVITVQQFRAEEHDHGVHIQMSISVDPQLTVLAASEIADYAKNLLLNRFTHVTLVQVQIVPYTGSYPYKSNYEPVRRTDDPGDGMLH